MPDTLRVFRLLLSCPGDVLEEQRLAAEVVEEFNQLWGGFFAVHLDPVQFKSHAYPMAAAYPQDAVNKALGDDYDLYVGIMWRKLGTPTPSADSGTVEEFERALGRYKTNPKSVQLMFYFRLISDIDRIEEPTGTTQVEAFRKRIGDPHGTGGAAILWHEYTHPTVFQGPFRIHLIRHVQDWMHAHPEILGAVAASSGADPYAKRASAASNAEPVPEQTRRAREHANDAVATVNEMSAVLNIFAKRLSARQAELPQAKTAWAMRDVLERSATVFREYTDRMDPLIARFSTEFAAAIDKASRAALRNLGASANPTKEYQVGLSIIIIALQLLRARIREVAETVFTTTGAAHTAARSLWPWGLTYVAPAVDALRTTATLTRELLRADERISEFSGLLKDLQGEVGEKDS